MFYFDYYDKGVFIYYVGKTGGWVEKKTTNYNGKTTVFVLPSVTPMKEQEDYMFFMKQNKNKVFHQKTLNN